MLARLSKPAPLSFLVAIVWLGIASQIVAGAVPSLVFVTKSDACNCVANLCVAGEQEVLNFLETAGAGLRFERVDLARNAAAGKKYRAVTLPVILLFDDTGEEIARFDSFVTEAQLAVVWQEHRSKGKVQP